MIKQGGVKALLPTMYTIIFKIKDGEEGSCGVLDAPVVNPPPRAYESYALAVPLHIPICGLFRGYYAFLPRYGGMLSSNNPML